MTTVTNNRACTHCRAQTVTAPPRFGLVSDVAYWRCDRCGCEWTWAWELVRLGTGCGPQNPKEAA